MLSAAKCAPSLPTSRDKRSGGCLGRQGSFSRDNRVIWHFPPLSKQEAEATKLCWRQQHELHPSGLGDGNVNGTEVAALFPHQLPGRCPSSTSGLLHFLPASKCSSKGGYTTAGEGHRTTCAPGVLPEVQVFPAGFHTTLQKESGCCSCWIKLAPLLWAEESRIMNQQYKHFPRHRLPQPLGDDTDSSVKITGSSTAKGVCWVHAVTWTPTFKL